MADKAVSDLDPKLVDILVEAAKAEDEAQGSLLELFRLRVLWLIYPLIFVSYAISGAIRGLWIGPYLADGFGAETSVIGTATLLMGAAMIAGTLAYGPAERLAPSRKWLMIGGTGATFACGLVLILLPDTTLWLCVALMCGLGFFGATYPVLVAHGRSFLPSHLIGRGVTMLNLCAIGGVGVLQFASGRIYAVTLQPGSTLQAYVAVFVLLTACLALGLVVYLFSRDSTKP